MRKQVSEYKANTSEYKKEYGKANYARFSLTVPKAREDAIRSHAKGKGESVNSLINRLLREDMGLTVEEWKQSE